MICALCLVSSIRIDAETMFAQNLPTSLCLAQLGAVDESGLDLYSYIQQMANR